jgi:hypothetical protein
VKRLWPVLLVLLMAWWPGVVVGDPVGPPGVPKDPVCGFIKNGHYLEAASVTNGLVVDMAVTGPARVNEPVTLRFFVRQKPGDIAVNDLQIEHEKYLHVIGVRDDLREFFHVHPVKVAPGIWEVTNTFPHGGNYKIWAQVAFLNGSYSFGQIPLSVAGDPGDPGPNTDRPDYERRAGYQITFKHTEPLVSGGTSSLQFLIRDAAGKEIETENFLGAAMHMVMVKDDLSVCLHAHPIDVGFADPVISFSQIFAKPGNYKLFAQFRPKGSNLPPDEAILAEFRVQVEQGQPASVDVNGNPNIVRQGSL